MSIINPKVPLNAHQLLTQAQRGIEQIGLLVHSNVLTQLIEYIDLLLKWNQTYNLTAIVDPMQILTKHLLDSLAIHPFITGPNILDFGTGAGLPGIPLALCFPESNFYLLDRVRKKTIFLQHVQATLQLKNLKIIHSRIEDYSPQLAFNTVVTRATSDISTLWNLTARLILTPGSLVVMKGKYPSQELTALKKNFEINRIVVPYLHEERHLVQVTK